MALDPVAYAESLMGGNERITVSREVLFRIVQGVSIMSRGDEAIACAEVATKAGATDVALQLLDRAATYNQGMRTELASRAEAEGGGP